MKVHHLNCGTMNPPASAPVVCHVLLVETDSGLVLVDTGFGSHDCADPAGRVGPLRHFLRPILSHDETAAHQIQRLGFRRDDVRHIVVTHLDLDHIGGLSDFPHAQIHVSAAEALGAITSPSRFEKTRYRCTQWAHQPKIVEHNPRGGKWRGFAAAKELDEISPGIVLISLPGHTRGHACVAVDAGRRWVLHGGDSFFHHGTLDRHSHVPRALAAMETLIAYDGKWCETTTPASQSSTGAQTPTYSSSAPTTGPSTSEPAHMRSGRPSDGKPMLNGAQALIRTLVDAGVTTCFTNPGTSEMHFVGALDTVPQMRAILTLFEGVATGAADGYARMADRPAATLLHLGPGLGNGLANLHNARKAKVPIVNIVGDHASYHVAYDAQLQSDIETVARNVSSWVRTTNTTQDLGRDAVEAVASTNGPPGQVATLTLPVDVSWEDGRARRPARTVSA